MRVLREYLEVLARLMLLSPLIKRLEERLIRRTTVTHVRLGSRPNVSRDPDDNIMIATARSGKAQFVVTNDRDLLEILPAEQATAPGGGYASGVRSYHKSERMTCWGLLEPAAGVEPATF
jgi:predicted nucleic acid-binding protein